MNEPTYFIVIFPSFILVIRLFSFLFIRYFSNNHKPGKCELLSGFVRICQDSIGNISQYSRRLISIKQ